MAELSDSEKELIRIYKELRLKDIEKSKKIKQDITLTEKSVLYKEIQEIQKELEKITKQFSKIFYQKWLKDWEVQNISKNI